MTNAILTSISPQLQFINVHGDLGQDLLIRFDNDVNKAQAALDNDYLGRFASPTEFARSVYEKSHDENGQLPEHLEHYTNMIDFAEDIFAEQYYAIVTGFNIHVFTRS